MKTGWHKAHPRQLKTEIIDGHRIGFVRSRAGNTSAYLIIPGGGVQYRGTAGSKVKVIQKIRGDLW